MYACLLHRSSPSQLVGNAHEICSKICIFSQRPYILYWRVVRASRPSFWQLFANQTAIWKANFFPTKTTLLLKRALQTAALRSVYFIYFTYFQTRAEKSESLSNEPLSAAPIIFSQCLSLVRFRCWIWIQVLNLSTFSTRPLPRLVSASQRAWFAPVFAFYFVFSIY